MIIMVLTQIILTYVCWKKKNKRETMRCNTISLDIHNEDNVAYGKNSLQIPSQENVAYGHNNDTTSNSNFEEASAAYYSEIK